jgi:hypothetical protein
MEVAIDLCHGGGWQLGAAGDVGTCPERKLTFGTARGGSDAMGPDMAERNFGGDRETVILEALSEMAVKGEEDQRCPGESAT